MPSAPLLIAARMVSGVDRKSTRLNSSHSQISYAVFCLKKKKVCESRLPVLLDIAELALRFPVHLSLPTAPAKIPAVLADPQDATLIAMRNYVHTARVTR